MGTGRTSGPARLSGEWAVPTVCWGDALDSVRAFQGIEKHQSSSPLYFFLAESVFGPGRCQTWLFEGTEGFTA